MAFCEEGSIFAFWKYPVHLWSGFLFCISSSLVWNIGWATVISFRSITPLFNLVKGLPFA